NPVTLVTQEVRTVTGYSSAVDQTDNTPFITASGQHVRNGIIAANWLPFGTQVRFPEIFGDKVFVVEDRMAPQNKNKVDIWFSSTQEALQFGVHRTTVEIL
ncbi:MAG: 3D domain-containing protein, partial [Bacteroidetes bacterium]|nr:3D domain-containing protein [Bacteroidota bacterium]